MNTKTMNTETMDTGDPICLSCGNHRQNCICGTSSKQTFDFQTKYRGGYIETNTQKLDRIINLLETLIDMNKK